MSCGNDAKYYYLIMGQPKTKTYNQIFILHLC